MIINLKDFPPDNADEPKCSRELDEATRKELHAFIRGAIYGWCKNCKDAGNVAFFAAVDIFGGENRDWTSTPLVALTKYYSESPNPQKASGQQLGHLLKYILHHCESREYTMRDGERKGMHAKEYCWLADE